MRRLSISALLLALCACAGKDPDIAEYTPPSIVEVTATAGADYSSVSITCRVSSADGILDYGILFGESELRRISATNLKENVFSVEVDGLGYSKRYVYQAYIDGGRGAVYSAAQVWTTVDETPPVPSIVRTTRAFGADAGKVTLACFIGQLAQTVGVDNLRCGVCYALSGTQPTLDDAYQEAAGFQESGNYSVDITGLTPTISYAFRPYSIIGSQVSYGEAVTLRIPSTAEVVLTEAATGVGVHSATLSGVLSADVDPSEQTVTSFELNGKIYLSSEMDETRHFTLTKDDLMPDTQYSFRAVARVGDNTFYGEMLSFKTDPLPVVEEDYVDFGLSVLWATCNLGASGPTENGARYAWGEIEPKTSVGWANYKWCMGSPETLTKYTLSVDSPQPDNKTRLDPEDDAAAVTLGGKWRMPTAAEFNELLDNCTVTETIVEDSNGILLTSKVPGFIGNSIFLPYPTLSYYTACYWTANLCSAYSAGARALIYGKKINENFVAERALYVMDIRDQIDYQLYQNSLDRCGHRLIRPVRDR